MVLRVGDGRLSLGGAAYRDGGCVLHVDGAEESAGPGRAGGTCRLGRLIWVRNGRATGGVVSDGLAGEGRLGLRAAVIAWLDDDNDTLRPVAAFGRPSGWVQSAEPQSISSETLWPLQESLTLRRPAIVDQWFSAFEGDRVIYVPLVSRQNFEGVLAIVAERGNSKVKDNRLLAALGMFMGLSLHR